MTRKLTHSYSLSVIAAFFVILTALTVQASNPPLFSRAVPYGAGAFSADSVAVADMNGDGKPDLLVANDSSVAVLLGNGDGTFQSAVNHSSGGDTPSFVAVADVNGDRKADLLVTNLSSDTVGVLLGNGDGTFQPAVTYSTGGSLPEAVAVADVNGDGKADLLVVNYYFMSPNVAVLLGNGDGTFQPAVTHNLLQSASSLAVADVNSDDKPDLVVGGPSVKVLLGNGDGTFQPPVGYPSKGLFVSSVVIADVNGDGKPDVVAANCAPRRVANCFSGAGSVAVLLGNGDGSFQPAVTHPSGGYNARSLAVTDVDGDGKLDVVVANWCSSANCIEDSPGVLGVLLGRGDGTFKSLSTYDPGGDLSDSVATADVNGDSRPDVVVANSVSGTVGVLLNIALRPTKTALSSSLNPSNYGQAVTFTATVTSTGPTPTGRVIFKDGTTKLGSAALSAGAAKLTTSTLAVGTHPITARYLGDSFNAKSKSPVLNQVVQ
jgi:hypothetical protein